MFQSFVLEYSWRKHYAWNHVHIWIVLFDLSISWFQYNSILIGIQSLTILSNLFDYYIRTIEEKSGHRIMRFLFPLAVLNIYLSPTSDNLNVFIIYQIILPSVCDLFWPVCTSCYIVTSILSHYFASMILVGLITWREIRSCTSSRFL